MRKKNEKNFHVRVPHALITDEILKKISGNSTKILIFLLFHSNGKGKPVFPSLKRLVSISGLSENTVRKSIQELCENEIINIEKKERKNIYHFSKIYFFDTNIENSITSKFDDENSNIENYSPQNLTSNKNKFKTNLTNTTQTEINESDCVCQKEFLNCIEKKGLNIEYFDKLIQKYPNRDYNAFKTALEKYSMNINNLGAWIKTAITENWTFSSALDNNGESSENIQKKKSIFISKQQKAEDDKKMTESIRYQKLHDIFDSLNEKEKEAIDIEVDNRIMSSFGESRLRHSLIRKGILYNVLVDKFEFLLQA